MKGTQSTDVVVVGAGPYGLAVATHLRGAGISTQVFGSPMSAWRDNMPTGMFLKSKWEATSISAPEPESTIIKYSGDVGFGPCSDYTPIPIGLFVNYGLRFQERHVRDLNQTQVTDISSEQGGFRITLADGDSLLAKSIVAASGHVPFAYIPRELKSAVSKGSGANQITHTCNHADFLGFSGRTVAVVGAGQSALESAVLLREIGAKVHLLVRGRRLLWGGPPMPSGGPLHRLIKPETPFGPGWSHFLFTKAPELFSHFPLSARLFLAKTTYGPAGAWWLKDRLDEQISVLTETLIEKAEVSSGKIHLRLQSKSKPVSSLAVDHVIAATGYQVDVNAIEYFNPVLRARITCLSGSGSPRLSHNFESSVEGLYFVGLPAAATFGPLQRFVYGSDFAARTICRSLAYTGVASRQSRAAAA